MVIQQFLLIICAAADKSASIQRVCRRSNERHVEYFEANNSEENSAIAWHLCSNKNATLPVICNRREQDKLTTYLKRLQIISAIWTSGNKNTFNEYRWTNGGKFENGGKSVYLTILFSQFGHLKLKKTKGLYTLRFTDV